MTISKLPLERAAKKFEAAQDALREAAFQYARKCTLALSLRLPTRTIHYLCGMGTTTIFVSARNGREYQLTTIGGWTGVEGRICKRLTSSLAFLEELDKLEADYRLTDIASGDVKAKNGSVIDAW
ncbi:MAG TPA: hypothetical protein VK629_05675 [Steroidobacteraceae bacterium]|nr:hypothetical protein [Steroidobacteraceae bacterium]